MGALFQRLRDSLIGSSEANILKMFELDMVDEKFAVGADGHRYQAFLDTQPVPILRLNIEGHRALEGALAAEFREMKLTSAGSAKRPGKRRITRRRDPLETTA